jgi:hypothetical protein
LRAAVSTGVPMAKWPRLPEGVKITSGSVDFVICLALLLALF